MLDLGQSVRDTLARGGDALALAYDGREYGWTWLRNAAAAIDAAVGESAAVALVARNTPGHVAAIAAQLAGGRTTCMIYAAQRPAGIAQDIAAVGAPVVIAATHDWSDEAVAAAATLGALGLELTDDPAAPVRIHPSLTVPGGGPFRRPSPDIAFEMLTSGTTGLPRRAPLRWDTVASAVADARTVQAGTDALAAPQIMVHPLGNVAGISFLLPPLAFGQAVCLLAKFSVEGWAEAVERYRPVRSSLPAAAVRMILDAHVPKARLASLQLVVVGGAAVAPAERDAFEARYGIPVLLALGATEFGGVVANWSLDLYRRFGQAKRGSVGRASPGVAFRIVDPGSFAVLPVDTIGLLEAQVARVGEGWLRTNDLARIDADGFVYLHGRADDAINRGGFKIVPERVADVLRSHPAIADAAVVGLADRRLGEVPVAAAELRHGVRVPSAEELGGFLRDRLLAYEVPAHIRVVDPLPRNASMKVALADVRALFAAEQQDQSECI